jgi:hypothetical protein
MKDKATLLASHGHPQDGEAPTLLDYKENRLTELFEISFHLQYVPMHSANSAVACGNETYM